MLHVNQSGFEDDICKLESRYQAQGGKRPIRRPHVGEESRFEDQGEKKLVWTLDQKSRTLSCLPPN